MHPGDDNSSADFEIAFERRANFLYALVTGTNSPETVAGYLERIVTECRRTDCYRVLIEERLEGPRLDASDVFAIASEGAMKAMGLLHAVAYVDQQMGPMAAFAETVAVNRGMPVRVFDTVAEADAWLRRQVEGPDEQHIFTGGGGNS